MGFFALRGGAWASLCWPNPKGVPPSKRAFLSRLLCRGMVCRVKPRFPANGFLRRAQAGLASTLIRSNGLKLTGEFVEKGFEVFLVYAQRLEELPCAKLCLFNGFGILRCHGMLVGRKEH